MIGAAFFEQERKRTGGLVDVEFRPTDDLRLDLQYFMSDLDATNYNRNYLLWGVTRPQRRRGPGAGSGLRRPEQHARRRRISRRAGCEDSRTTPDRTVRSLRPDLAPGRKGELELRQSRGRATEVSDAFDAVRPDRHVGGPRRDTDAGRVRDAPATGQRRGLAAAMASAARRTSTSAPPTPRHRSRAARRSPSAGSSAPSSWTSRTRRTGPRSMPTSPIDDGAWTDLKFGVRYNEHERDSLNAVAQGPLGPPATDPGELSDDVPELSVRLQHLRRVVPDGHLVLVAVAARGLQRRAGFVNRDPRGALDCTSSSSRSRRRTPRPTCRRISRDRTGAATSVCAT